MSEKLSRIEIKKANTLRRHQMIRERVDELYKIKVDNMRLDYDAIISKVAGEFGLSERTIRNILKANS